MMESKKFDEHKDYLKWLYTRLVEKYKENPRQNYLLVLQEVILFLEENKTVSVDLLKFNKERG